MGTHIQHCVQIINTIAMKTKVKDEAGQTNTDGRFRRIPGTYKMSYAISVVIFN